MKRFLMALLCACSVMQAQVKSSVEPVGKRIVYKTVDGKQLAIFVVTPAGGGVHPAMLMIHGGGWQSGSLAEFNRQAEYLAGRGIVAVQVEYRLIGNPIVDSIVPCVMDAKSAMRYVRSHAAELGVDPGRIGAMGSSAGAQLAGFLGMMDGFDDPKDDLKVSAKANLMVLISAAVDVSICCHGKGSPDGVALSPNHHVKAGEPPTLLMHSKVDQSVSPAMVQKFADDMKAAGNDFTMIWFPTGGHGFFHNGPDFYASLEDTDKFLVEHHWLQGAADEAALRALPAKEER